MKFTDLREKKGPIIGAPKGSQKDSRLTPGTDDPSKYMRGGEWEAYTEPQGVNSNAGKIAGGEKKGTTRTKNKKVSENKGIEQFADQGLAENPSRQYVDQLMRRAVQGGGVDPHLKGLYDPRGRFWIWDSEDEHVWHMEVESALIDKYDLPDFDDWYHVVGPDLEAGGYTDEQVQEYFNNAGGYIPIIISPMDKKKGGIGKIWSGSENALKTPEVRKALSEAVRRALVAEGIGDTLRGMRDKIAAEGIQAGGPGVSGDLVPADRHATTISMVKDTAAANIKKSPNLPGSEAPTKFVKKQIKKSLDNRPGNISDINEAVNKILAEAIPRVTPSDYSADYDLRDDENQESIGVASITHGVIELLSVRNDVIEDYNGHIMSRLLSTIVRDADAANAHLAIPLDNPDDLQHKRFLERFGFRAVGEGIMKRNAGSVTPPSVPSNSW